MSNLNKVFPTVEFKLGGKTRRLKLDWKAIARIEEKKDGESFFSIIKNLGFSTIAVLIWGGLLHDDKNLTLEDVENQLDFGEFNYYMSDVLKPALDNISVSMGLVKKNPDESVVQPPSEPAPSPNQTV